MLTTAQGPNRTYSAPRTASSTGSLKAKAAMSLRRRSAPSAPSSGSAQSRANTLGTVLQTSKGVKGAGEY